MRGVAVPNLPHEAFKSQLDGGACSTFREQGVCCVGFLCEEAHLGNEHAEYYVSRARGA